ncbi:hypothetical protein [Methylobacter luteus]|uniref:hypothetical protein n=1 Tax=Methylobacter luteus TaxID=415 RepID=UPI000480D39F|nr:hypothetical protein [Methylobacter luteus]
MSKNIGNINYIQKNKTIVLSLIGVGFLTGAAVIDKVVPGQEIADAHRIRSVEKLNVPPYSVVPKDKLLQIKPKNEPMALIYNGWVNAGTVSGYNVQYRTITTASDVIYQILGTSTLDGSQLGFACFCANNNTKLIWEGMANSACAAANPNTPVKLDNAIMGSYKVYNVPIPDGSCCKSVPRVGTTNIPGLPPCG